MIIYVISNTILDEKNISGGDILLPKLSHYLNPELKLVVVTNSIGKSLWQKYGKCSDFHIVEDIIDVKWLWFAPVKYILRTFKLFFYFFKISKYKEKTVVYTSSDLFPDTIPIFLHKLIDRDIYWISRIYHINKSPLKRKGKFSHNLFSYFSQQISIPLIKFKSDLILTLAGTRKILRNLKFPKKKTRVLNAGVNEELIKSAPTNNETFSCFYLGTIVYTKGAFDLLDVWAEVVKNRKNYQLAVIGGGVQEIISKFKEKISTLNLSDNIKYFGRIEKDEDVYSIIKSSKVCIIPGHENGWSLPATEAMTAGVPIVGYALDMFGEAFKKGFAVSPLYDHKALAEKICEVLENKEIWETLHQEALDESSKFSWKNIAEDFEQFLDKLN
jgi:glycosyltransferase involved in cell wall biosynthesis